jgi:hypothetical protein
MRSRNDTTRPTTTHPDTPAPAAPRRTRATRATTGGGRRRARPAMDAPSPGPMLPALGPISVYRAEKARRASALDDGVMAEAKREYDEMVAESSMKRAGMRSSVVTVGRRGRKPAGG